METCGTCGFRSDLYTKSDLRGTIAMAPHVARQLLSTVPAPLVPELTELLTGLEDLDPDVVDVDVVHDAMHRLHLAGRRVPRQQQSGTVVQVSASGGGVPKLPLSGATISLPGLDGDKQGDRQHHGRPWQALCLWSAEVIEGLQAEGHPIAFGSAGENLTIRGLEWPAVTPGARLLVGTALLQATSYAIPCAKNADWFSDGGFRRMAQEVRPGGSRVYAAVVAPGVVSPGDAAVLEP
jgi:MOSC domain-containing protein YiiM